MTELNTIEWPNGPSVQMIFPAVFFEPVDKPYRPELSDLERRGCAIADAMSAWACCHMGQIPPNFGEIMVKLGNIIGGSAYGDDLKAAADQWHSEWDAAKESRPASAHTP